MSNEFDTEAYNPDIYTLTDEEGVEQVFELLDVMEHKDQRYFALTPFYENPEDALDDEADLIILKSEFDEDEQAELMISIDDDDEYQEVGKIFLDKLTQFFEETIFDDE